MHPRPELNYILDLPKLPLSTEIPKPKKLNRLLRKSKLNLVKLQA